MKYKTHKPSIIMKGIGILSMITGILTMNDSLVSGIFFVVFGFGLYFIYDWTLLDDIEEELNKKLTQYANKEKSI